jgi:hypothetical protein
MAGIAYSVRKAIDDFELGDLDGAMMHACNAFDGTSKSSIQKSASTNADLPKRSESIIQFSALWLCQT